MYQLIDGKAISQQIKDELKEKVEKLKTQGTEICLAVIQVGNDPASGVYVNNKKKACAYIGIQSLSYELPEETTEEELLKLIGELNAKEEVNGILVQLPLPKQINEEKIRFSSCKCGESEYRKARICLLYACRRDSAFKEVGH